MSKNKVLTVLKYFGIGVAGIGLGLGAGKIVCDVIDNHYTNMSAGLPLLAGGVHMKEGNHNVIITDQFSDLLHYDTTEEDEKLVVDAFKEAYNTLNQYNSKVKFTLCSTDENLATKYNLTKVEKWAKDDIPLYLTTEVLDNSQFVLAHTDWNYDTFSREMKDLSITYTKKGVLTVYTVKDTLEETLSAKNAQAYTITVHETMHAMGFAHVDDHESIMNTYLRTKSPKDLTEYDKELLDKYNVHFYNAEPTYNTDVKMTSEQADLLNKYNVTYSSYNQDDYCM